MSQSTHHDTTFAPDPSFANNARIRSMEQYESMYRESIDSPDTFWAKEAEELHWQQPWEQVLQWEAPITYFVIRARAPSWEITPISTSVSF